MLKVCNFMEGLGAPPEAIKWATVYGTDLRRAWDECCHPELLLPMAAGAGAPDELVINGAIEVMRSCLDGLEGINPVFEVSARRVERFLCGHMAPSRLAKWLGKVGAMMVKADLEDRVNTSVLGGTIHLMEGTLLCHGGAMHEFQTKLSTSVMFAAQARSERLGYGYSDQSKEDIMKACLRRTSVLARAYVPYETMVGGVIGCINYAVHGDESKVGCA